MQEVMQQVTQKETQKVIIVGGGSAGWITACYLNAQINSHINGTKIDLTLIESQNTGWIGVGEATIPTLINTLKAIGIGEKEFMTATDATFKQGIKFVNWLKDSASSYYHPFDKRQSGANDLHGVNWSNSARSKSFAKTVSSQPTFCEAGLSPKGLNQPDYQAPMTYAYHLDAEKLGELLRKKGKQTGITHLLGDITQVVKDQYGNIAKLLTADGSELYADLFIDCTGFSCTLLGDALGVEFIDYSQWLLCDRAVTMQVPFTQWQPPARKPYTTSTALSSGWVWDIPLASRRGIGYVYASDYLTEQEAERELRTFEGHHAANLTCNHLKFRSGRRQVSWKNNCIAIGLASGFLEPLESTGIYLIEFAAALLCEYFPYSTNTQPQTADETCAEGNDSYRDDIQVLRDNFNSLVKARYEELLDFIVLHYCLTMRNDTIFWRDVQKSDRIPVSLQNKFDLWRFKPCTITDFHDAMQLFGHINYEYILYGMDYRYRFNINTFKPGTSNLKVNSQDNVNMDFKVNSYSNHEVASPLTKYVAKEIQIGMQKLPMHDEWLQKELGSRYNLNI